MLRKFIFVIVAYTNIKTMKTKYHLIACLIALCFFTITCKKVDTENSKGLDKTFKSADYITPSFPTAPNIAWINDQIDYLARGICALANDTATAIGSTITPFRTSIINNMEAENDEVFFNTILKTSQLFRKPITGNLSNECGDALNWSISNEQFATGVYTPGNAYDSTAIEGYHYINGDYNTLIRIPELELAKISNIRYRPVCVVPILRDPNQYLDEIVPLVGYYFNNTTHLIDTIMFYDPDDMFDQSTFWIWFIDVRRQYPQNWTDIWPCDEENSWISNDKFCDSLCGENSTNSPTDCNGGKYRKLSLDWVALNTDEKQSGLGYNTNYMESFIRGAYEVGYYFVIKKGQSNKFQAQGAVLNKRWDNGKQVRRENHKGNGSIKANSGQYTVKNDLKRAGVLNFDPLTGIAMVSIKSPQDQCILTKDFDPVNDTIFIMFFEWDNLHADDRAIIKLTKMNNMFMEAYFPFWERDNGYPGGKYLSVTQNPTTEPVTGEGFYNIIEITPGMWSSGGTLVSNATYTCSGLYNPSANSGSHKYFFNFGLKYEPN